MTLKPLVWLVVAMLATATLVSETAFADESKKEKKERKEERKKEREKKAQERKAKKEKDEKEMDDEEDEEKEDDQKKKMWNKKRFFGRYGLGLGLNSPEDGPKSYGLQVVGDLAFKITKNTTLGFGWNNFTAQQAGTTTLHNTAGLTIGTPPNDERPVFVSALLGLHYVATSSFELLRKGYGGTFGFGIPFSRTSKWFIGINTHVFIATDFETTGWWGICLNISSF